MPLSPRPAIRLPLAVGLAAAVLLEVVGPPRTVEAAPPTPQAAAVIVVGPAGRATSQHRLEARQMAAQLRGYGARVRLLTSPWATLRNVKNVARGANLFVYLGRGRGHPGPYGAFDPRRLGGLGLNRSGGEGDANVTHYGEFFVARDLDLAENAVVILEDVPYAGGSSEAGRAAPTRRTAMLRADNYAAGFLRAGAVAVFASDRPATSILQGLFLTGSNMQSIFWHSPWTSARYGVSFRSGRSVGESGLLAPYGPGRYYQSVVGNLRWTASAWRRSWAASPAGTGNSVRVSSVTGLLAALADDAVGDIVVANGIYHVSTAASQAADSLWIGARYAGRTRPVTVRAETTGGVTFSGGGATAFGGLSFEAGAHDQTWDGFVFADGQPTQTGVITFGGYAGLAAPHHITLRNISLPRSLTTASSGATDGGLYFSQAVGGPHDISVDGLTVDGAGGLDFAVQFYHSTDGNPNAWNVSLRHLRVSGTQQAIILWDSTVHDVAIEDSTISGAEEVAIRYESPGATGILLAGITSTNSGSGKGFSSTLGPAPPGITFVNNSFH